MKILGKFDLDMSRFVRQGDVALVPILGVTKQFITAGFKKTKKDINKRVVLAFGETTGHAHSLYGEDTELLEHPEAKLRVLVAKAPDALVHGNVKAEATTFDHTSIPVPVDNYIVIQQNEYSPKEIVRALD